MHSTASDGTDTPGRLPRLAKEAGLAAIALTDHDTTDGLVHAKRQAAKRGVRFLTGIELSADPNSVWPDGGELAGVDEVPGTLHILGYGVSWRAAALQAVCERARKARAERNPQIIERLAGLGVRIRLDEVEAEAGDGVIGRPHLAKVLVRKGYARSVHEAFRKYIGRGGAAYVRKDRLDAADAVAAIHAAGGLAVLAHPVQLGLPDPAAVEHYVKALKDHGLDGLETRHSDHTPDTVAQLDRLADRLNLIATGGSDYHGETKPVRLGEVRVDLDVFDRLEDAVNHRGAEAQRRKKEKSLEPQMNTDSHR